MGVEGLLFCLKTLGEDLGLLEDEVTVEEIEGLKRCGGATAFGDSLAGIGTIEGSEDLFPFLPDFGHVDHASPVFGAVGLLGMIVADVFHLHFEWTESWTTCTLKIQRTAHGKYGVADAFGFEATKRESPEQSGSGIDLHGFGARDIGLLPGGGMENQALDVLERPLILHQFHGQPVEELGMGRRSSIESEVTGSVDDSCAEMKLPEPIHDDSGG